MRHSTKGFCLVGLWVFLAALDIFMPPIRRVYDVMGGFSIAMAAHVFFDALRFRRAGV